MPDVTPMGAQPLALLAAPVVPAAPARRPSPWLRRSRLVNRV